MNSSHCFYLSRENRLFKISSVRTSDHWSIIHKCTYLQEREVIEEVVVVVEETRDRKKKVHSLYLPSGESNSGNMSWEDSSSSMAWLTGSEQESIAILSGGASTVMVQSSSLGQNLSSIKFFLLCHVH